MGLFRNDGPQPWHPANDDLKKEIVQCISLAKNKGDSVLSASITSPYSRECSTQIKIYTKLTYFS